MINISDAAAAFSAVGSEPRLSVLNLLVRAGENGLNVGSIKDRLDIPPSTLAHHLRCLADAGLITQSRRGREIINCANYKRLMELGAFLMKECCADEGCL